MSSSETFYPYGMSMSIGLRHISKFFPKTIFQIFTTKICDSSLCGILIGESTLVLY
jgi:hypothetical protein